MLSTVSGLHGLGTQGGRVRRPTKVATRACPSRVPPVSLPWPLLRPSSRHHATRTVSPSRAPPYGAEAGLGAGVGWREQGWGVGLGLE